MKKYLKTLSSLILIITTISSCEKKEDEVLSVETVNLDYTNVSSSLTNPIAVVPFIKGQSASITWNNASLKAGNPFIISGVYIDPEGDDWLVKFVLDENLLFDFSLTDVNLKKGLAYNGPTAFNWSELTKGIITKDFPSGSKMGVKEPIVISSTSNVSLFQKIRANLVNIAKVAIN